ncbi:HTH domain-containing protein [Halomicrobium salinisoli]|uniref:HTH domain-containing protein n=1 Tax=Halomicrobium salinisoli TaxID=2878391 RepID=UPI001CEFD929|nr:HTH domain-containing protein [Halomicrobium salinisoli]
MPTTDDAVRAELYVREDLPKPVRDCRRRTIAHLERLVAAGALDGFEVTSWAKRVPLEGASTPRPERDCFNAFSAWAREAGVRLAPFFDTRLCYSMETGEKRTELVTPAVCLAVYDGEDLRRVAPYATEEGTTTVTECLDELARERLDDRDRQVEPGTAD